MSPLFYFSLQVQMIRHEFDFIKVNGRNARNAKIPRAASATALDNLKKKDEEAMTDYSMGEVPL